MNFKYNTLINLYLLFTITSIYENSLNLYYHENKIIGNLISHKVSCTYKNNNVDVITEYRKILNTNNKADEKILVLNQKLIFYVDKKIVSKIIFPFKTSDYSINKGKKIKIKNTVITKVKYLEKDGDIIYSFYGTNTTESPHEFFGITTSYGEWIQYYYGNNKEVYKEYGANDDLIKKYGSKITSLKDMIKTFPPPAKKL